MSEKDVVITYETLFELLRIEKNREDLQKLDNTFFEDVKSYLTEKREAFESQEEQSTLFASDDKERARQELENIKKILKDLYDRREKKIVYTALSKARTGVMLANTGNMLTSEKMLFEALNTTLSEFRKRILFKLACGDIPNIDSLPDSVISKLNCSLSNGGFGTEDIAPDDDVQQGAPEQEQVHIPERADDPAMVGGSLETPDSAAESPPDSHFKTSEEPKELKTSQNLSDSSSSIKKVRFLAAIGEIVGPDLQIYGPYDEGAVIDLPKELASVLVEKEQAEEVLG